MRPASSIFNTKWPLKIFELETPALKYALCRDLSSLIMGKCNVRHVHRKKLKAKRSNFATLANPQKAMLLQQISSFEFSLVFFQKFFNFIIVNKWCHQLGHFFKLNKKITEPRINSSDLLNLCSTFLTFTTLFHTFLFIFYYYTSCDCSFYWAFKYYTFILLICVKYCLQFKWFFRCQKTCLMVVLFLLKWEIQYCQKTTSFVALQILCQK